MPTPEINSQIDEIFHQQFGRNTHAAPVAVSKVQANQPFIRDATPNELLIRAFFPTESNGFREDAVPFGNQYRVVVIGSADEPRARKAGDIFYMEGRETVRLVEIVQPAKVRAR